MILTGWYTKKSDIQTCTPSGNIQYHPSHMTLKWNLIKPLDQTSNLFSGIKRNRKICEKASRDYNQQNSDHGKLNMIKNLISSIKYCKVKKNKEKKKNNKHCKKKEQRKVEPKD